MKGGAVSEERSPETEAILNNNEDADTSIRKIMKNLRFEKRGPASTLSRWHCLYAMSDDDDDDEKRLTEDSDSDMDVSLKAGGLDLTYYFPLITCSHNITGIFSVTLTTDSNCMYVRYRRKEKSPGKLCEHWSRN
jgi:hypothetical protein